VKSTIEIGGVAAKKAKTEQKRNIEILNASDIHTRARRVREQVTDNPKQRPIGNAIKVPENWVTGDEPMTGARASYLQTLSEEAGEPVVDSFTKAQASERIDALQEKTGRGAD
jgi:hypothetical protein